jgi:hypothetical protein
MIYLSTYSRSYLPTYLPTYFAYKNHILTILDQSILFEVLAIPIYLTTYCNITDYIHNGAEH